ncbi:MAG: hypothetical protein LBD46_06635 [Endomicrobium sp.]|jgi:hypothetical protein|nr:hypothetical protein [Endomicrobium sp.]
MKRMKLMLLAVVMFFHEALDKFHWRVAVNGIPGFMTPMCLFEMTPEEKTAFDEAKAKAEAAEKELKELKEKQKLLSVPPNPNPTLEDLIAKSKKDSEEQAKIKEINNQLERAVEFNYKIETFAKENKEIVGDEVINIIELSKGRNYDTGIEKANELRSAILNKYFSVQSNIDALRTESFKKKATEFLALTQIKRNELSDEYWELFELSVENIRRDKKQAELVKAENGIETNDFQKKYKEKLAEQANEYYFPGKFKKGA